MPYHQIPFLYTPSYYSKKNKSNSGIYFKKQNIDKKYEYKKIKPNNSNNFNKYSFELFGLRLFFDDILLICFLFLLYTENKRDDELFLVLLLLLID